MLVSGKIDTYRKRDRFVLDVSTGPGRWLYCSWSLCTNTGRFELSIEAHHHGLMTLGRITTRVGVTNVDSTKMQNIVRATRSVVWHPSGEMIAIVEGGHVLLFSVNWLRKTRETREVRCSKISMCQASEIHYTQLAESAGQEHEDGGSSSGHSTISVKLSVLHRSVYIGATSASLVSQPGSPQPSASLLVGTDSGAVLRLDWNSATYIDIDNEKDVLERLVEESDLSESEAEDVASQRRRLAHSETAAGRLLAEVVLPALSGREEDRDLLRLWQHAEFHLAPAAAEAAEPPAVLDIGEVRPADAVTPIVFATADVADDDQSRDPNGDNEDFAPRSYRTPVSAGSICQLLYSSASRTLLCLYQDGSMSFSLIGDLLSTTVVRRSARIHPVSMVAYSLYGALPGDASTHGPRRAHAPATPADCAPAIFELGAAGAYRSSDYVTGWDVEGLLELTPTLLQKVRRMRSLVTGRAEEEIGRVLTAHFVEGDSGTHVLCLVQCRHMPSLTYVSDQSDNSEGTGGGNLLGERMESLFLVLLKLTPPPSRASTIIAVKCVQAVCVEKYRPCREEWPGAGTDAALCQLEVMRVQPDGSAHALLMHSSGLITCRALDSLQTALFAVRTDVVQDLPRSLPAATSFTVSLNRLVVSMSSPLQPGVTDAGTEGAPLTALSRVAVVPLLTSGTSGGLPGHRSGLLVDLVEEELLCPGPDRDEDRGGEQGREGDPSMYSTSLDSWRLQLPGRLMDDVRRLQALSVSNPQLSSRRPSHPSYSRLLVADSNSCHHSRGILDIGSSTAYLAMCAGGEAQSMKSAVSKDGTKAPGTLLWVYNRRTRRWRSSRLSAGIRDSRARLVKDIPVDSGAEARAIGTGNGAEGGGSAHGQRRRSENDIPIGRSPEKGGRKALEGSSESDRHTAAFSVQALLTPWSTTQLTTGSDASSLRSSTVPISVRSHLAGDPRAVLSIAWFSTHSLVLLTLRRSCYCIELLSRVVTKSGPDSGKPLPVVHQIIALPPGYSPTALETVAIPASAAPTECDSDSDVSSVDSSPLDTHTVSTKPVVVASDLGVSSPRGTARTQSGVNSMLEPTASCQQCAVVVTDGTTLLCYRVCAMGELASSAATSTLPSAARATPRTPTRIRPSRFFQVSDYSVTELWDVKLSSLKVFPDLFAEQVCTPAAASGAPLSERHSPQLPLRELRPFLQSAPYRDDQGLPEAVVSGRFDGPKVSLLALDAVGCVWLIDTSRSACFLVNAGPVHRMSQVQLGRTGPSSRGHQLVSSTRSLFREEDRLPQLYEAFIFHFIRERSAQAQSRLLYIFQKTSLVQHLRHSCAGEVERCSLQRSTLWAPMQWLSQSLRKHRRRDADTVHNFSDADIPVNRSAKEDAGLHSVATVSLPSLPSGTQLLYVSGDGVRVALSCGTVDLTRGSPRCDAFAHAQLYFLPVLCAMLSSIVEGDAQASVVNVEFTVSRSLQKDTAVNHASRLLCQRALSRMRSTASGTAHLVAHCEQLVKRWTESKGFTHEHAAYCCLTGLLFDADAALLCEVLSRLGRKLEPSVSRLLFPARIDCPFSAESSVQSSAVLAGVVGLFNAALTVGHIHHAARLLSLACEAVGGSETHISTAASLFLALELLGVSGHSVSLRNVMECFDFCTRLEDTLVMHSRSIFGDRASNHPAGESNSHSTQQPQHGCSLDSSYVRTVKSRAVSLIVSKISSTARKCETPKSAAHQFVSSLSVPSPLASASPALPYYIGMGVGWVLSRAAQNLAGQTPVAPAPTHTDHTAINNSATIAPSSRPQLQLQLQTISTEEDGASERGAQSTTELLRSVLLRGSQTTTTAPRCCAIIDALEVRHGAALLSRMLSRTSNIVAESTRDAATMHSPPNADEPRAPLESDRSPTLLTLVMIFEDLFSHSSHYCNAAALMTALLQNPVAVDLLKHHLLSGPPSNAHVSVVDSPEKVRRILYVFRLSKALARESSQATAYLMQRVSAQYLRRVVEADGSPFPQGSSHHGTPHAALPRSCSSEGAVLAAARAADYFELTDDMIDHSSSALSEPAEPKVPVQRERLRSRGDSFRDTLPPPPPLSPNSPGTRAPAVADPPQAHLTLLELLKALALSLLLIGDSAAAGLLLCALSKPLARADPRLSAAVRAVPPPSRLSGEPAVPRAEADEEGDFVWELSPAQYADLVDALANRV